MTEVRSQHASALPPLACDLFGVALPDRADRHGLGLRRAADRGHRRRPAAWASSPARPMTLTSCEPRSPRSRQRTAEPFGVNLRADQPDVGAAIDLLITRRRQGRLVRAGAEQELIARLKEPAWSSIALDRRSATPRRSPRGAPTRSSRRAARAAATPARPDLLLLPQVVDAVDIPVVRRRRLLRRPRPGGGAGLRRRRHRDGHPLPADRGLPVARRGQAALPEPRSTTRVVTTVLDGVPQRVLRRPVATGSLGGRGALARRPATRCRSRALRR